MRTVCTAAVWARAGFGLVMLAAWASSAGASTLLHFEYSSNGGTRVEDLSGNEQNGTLVGFLNTSPGAGQFNVTEGWVADGGISFLSEDGFRSHVQTSLPVNSLYDTGSGQNKDFTIEYSASFTGTPTWAPAVASDYDPFDDTQAFFLGVHSDQTGNEVRLPSGGGGPIGAQPWSPAPDSDLQHVALTFEAATSRAEVFVNGVSKGFQIRSATNMDTPALFRVGNVGWADGEQWGGVMYGTAISDEVLGRDTFVLPYTPDPIEPPDPPVGTLLHYDFTANGGTTVTDLSGQGNDGTLTDFANTSAGAGAFNVSEGWVDGGGVSFLDDSVRSFVETPLPLSDLEDKNFTVEYTANFTGTDDWAPAVASNAQPIFFLGVHNDQLDNEVNVPGGGGGPIGPQPWVAPDTTEHHVALTYNAETLELEVFVDEVSVGTATRVASMTSDVLFRIGNVGWADSEQWGGVISGVAISDVLLVPGDFVLLGGSPVVLGDVNLDGEVNGLDVDPFVDVLLNGPYQVEADMNEDKVVNGLDVDPFVAKVVGGAQAAVPEPSTLALVLAGLIGLLAVRRSV
jgi:hypothetical protein